MPTARRYPTAEAGSPCGQGDHLVNDTGPCTVGPPARTHGLHLRPGQPGCRYSRRVDAFESVSTWRQPMPAAASSSRSELVTRVAADVVARSDRRIRVAIDGR